MFPLLAIPAIAKAGFGIFQSIKAGKIHPQYSPYQTSQYAQNRLGMAQGLFNGRMSGAPSEERNIYANNANTVNNINRGATDSSQALALAAGAQGQTNNAFNNLGIEEAKNKYSLLDNLNNGYDAMTAEGDKSYADKMKKFEIDTGQKNALMGAGINNIFGGINDGMSAIIQQKQQKQQGDFYNKYLGMMGGFSGGGQ